jgi:hypothetical protein
MAVRRRSAGKTHPVAILYLGGVAGVIAFVLALYAGGTIKRTGLLLGVGLCLTAAWLLLIYLSATPSDQSPGCSDCGIHFGRWLDMAAIVIVVGGNAVAWVLGVLLGSGLRALARSRR